VESRASHQLAGKSSFYTDELPNSCAKSFLGWKQADGKLTRIPETLPGNIVLWDELYQQHAKHFLLGTWDFMARFGSLSKSDKVNFLGSDFYGDPPQ
jgi:hypothetical protein